MTPDDELREDPPPDEVVKQLADYLNGHGIGTCHAAPPDDGSLPKAYIGPPDAPGEWVPLGDFTNLAQASAAVDTEKCWPLQIAGTTVVARSTRPMTPEEIAMVGEIVEAAKRKAATEPPNPRSIAIDALADRLPDVPLHRRVAAANAVLRALDTAGMLTVTLDGIARATDGGLTIPIAATTDGVLVSPTDQPTHTLTIGMPRERAEAFIAAAEDAGEDIVVSLHLPDDEAPEPDPT